MNFLVGNSPVMKLPSISQNFPHLNRSRTPGSQSSFFNQSSSTLGSSSFHQAFLNYYFLHTSTAFNHHLPTYHTSERNTRLLHHAYRDRQEEESLDDDAGARKVVSKPPRGIGATPPGQSGQRCWHQETKPGATAKLLSTPLD